jgi:molybdopterin-biosynthesis enzyme MoeA-like protein
MKDARGLDVTSDDATAVAAADAFAARLLRLDQGVEAILEAVKTVAHDAHPSTLRRRVLALWPDRGSARDRRHASG